MVWRVVEVFCTFPTAIRLSATVNGILLNVTVQFQALHLNMKKKNAVIENTVQEVLLGWAEQVHLMLLVL